MAYLNVAISLDVRMLDDLSSRKAGDSEIF